MCIREIGIDNPLWDSYVDDIGDGFVFFKKKYLNAFRKMNDQLPIMMLYESGDDKAVNVCYKRDVSADSHFNGLLKAGQYYDLISPYGYGGYVGIISDYETLAEEHYQYCTSKGYVCEVIKFFPLSEFCKYYHGSVETPFHNVVCDLRRPIEEIYSNFKPKVRKNVKKATSYNLKAYIDDSGNRLDEFIRIYYSTMERNDADQSYFFSESFFKIINEMTNQFVYFFVASEDKIVSAELVLYDDIYCYSYLGGTDSEFYHMRPNDYLKYEIIKWGNQKGLKGFVLGGGHGADDGIFQYKTALAPDGILDFCVGTDIFVKDTYNMLCEARSEYDPEFTLQDRIVPAYRF